MDDNDDTTVGKTIRIPFPDPTERTLEQSRREIAQLKELLEADLEAIRAQGDMRYGLARELLDTRLGDHAHLTTERFESIRRETMLALSAAQAAVDKAEQSTTKTIDAIQVSIAKQLEALSVQVGAEVKALEEQIIAVKERQDRSEGKGAGIATSWGVIVAAVGAVGVLISIVVVVTNLLTNAG